MLYFDREQLHRTVTMNASEITWIDIAVNAISDKMGHDTLIIDVGDVLGISDTSIITSGMNSRQVRHWSKKSKLK